MWSLLTNLKFSTVWCESSAIIINSYCLYWKHANKIGELPNVPHWNQPRLERGHLNTRVETGFAHDVMVRREQQIKRTSVETVFLPLTSHRLWSPKHSMRFTVQASRIPRARSKAQSILLQSEPPEMGSRRQQTMAFNNLYLTLVSPGAPWRYWSAFDSHLMS